MVFIPINHSVLIRRSCDDIILLPAFLSSGGLLVHNYSQSGPIALLFILRSQYFFNKFLFAYIDPKSCLLLADKESY